MKSLLGLVVALVVMGTVTACAATHTVSTSPSGGTTEQSTQKQPPPKAAAVVGSKIVLNGNDSGEKMAVTLVKVIPTAKPSGEFNSAPAGDRLYAAQFRLTDVGSAAYSDSPSNGAAVVDSKGQSYDGALGDDVANCVSFPGTENIAPGNFGLGCIVFEVPKRTKIKTVQFTLDSGFGPDTGQWTVK